MASRSPNELRPDLRHVRSTQEYSQRAKRSCLPAARVGQGCARGARRSRERRARRRGRAAAAACARETRPAYGSVDGDRTVARDLHATRPRDVHENGRGRRGNGAAAQGARRTVAAVSALRCRRILRVRCARAARHGESEGTCTDGARRPRVRVTGADRVRVEEESAFVPVTAARERSLVLGTTPDRPKRSGRVLTRLRAADPRGVLRARGVAPAAPGVGLCAHHAARSAAAARAGAHVVCERAR